MSRRGGTVRGSGGSSRSRAGIQFEIVAKIAPFLVKNCFGNSFPAVPVRTGCIKQAVLAASYWSITGSALERSTEGAFGSNGRPAVIAYRHVQIVSAAPGLCKQEGGRTL